MFRRTTIYTLECKVMQQSVRNGHKGQHPCHSVDAISNSRRLPTLRASPPAHAGHAGHERLRHSGTAWWQPHASDARGSVAWWQPHDGYVWVCIGTYLSLHLRVSRPAVPVSQLKPWLSGPNDSDSPAGWVKFDWCQGPSGYHIIYCLFLLKHSWNSIACWLIRWRSGSSAAPVRTPTWACFYSYTILVSLWYVLVCISSYTYVLVCIGTYMSVVMHIGM